MTPSVTQDAGAGAPVTRDDIEAKLRALRGEVDELGQSTKQYAIAGAALAAVVVVGLAFVLGKRKGKRKTTVVEVRRV
jgi:hypothetical protein